MSLNRTVRFLDLSDQSGDPELLLQLTSPPSFDEHSSISKQSPLVQLRAVFELAKFLGSKSIAIEEHYVDRDFMEDFANFYARCFFPYPNSCRRVHFFSGPADEIQKQIASILATGRSREIEAYLAACREFSIRYYQGFMVIRPLHGTPVGRTVLSPPKPASNPASSASTTDHFVTRPHPVHFAGLELQALGVPFQQQDIAVGACATSATWASLQMLQTHEVIAAPTPAQITTLATRNSLPYGRPMPSDGLNVDQMCQAVQSLGISPNYIKTDRRGFVARAVLYSLLRSEIVPVLLLEDEQRRHHAVAAVGMRLTIPHRPHPFEIDLSILEKSKSKETAKKEADIVRRLDDVAGDLIGVYVHDDRKGPYVYGELNASGPWSTAELSLTSIGEKWAVIAILAPTYPKVRLPLTGLRKMAIFAAGFLEGIWQCAAEGEPEAAEPPRISVESWIEREYRYIRRCIAGEVVVSDSAIAGVLQVSFPRYVGVIRLRSEAFGVLDVLCDTTCTVKNPHFLCIVAHGNSQASTGILARILAEKLGVSNVCQ